MIVADCPVRTNACALESLETGLPGSLTEGRVFYGVIYLEQERRQIIAKTPKRPASLACWLVALRNLSNVARDLCITTQVVNKLAVRRAEESFASFRTCNWAHRM